VGGGAAITSGTKASFKATDVIDVKTTADGNVPNTAGATFAVTVIDSNTTAAITGNAAVTAPTVDLAAASTRTIATKAISTPGGTGNPGLAIAAALNFVGLHVNARLGGTINLQAAAVNVTATESAASTFTADATSGAGSQGVGIAGALALNSVSTSTRAFVAN